MTPDKIISANPANASTHLTEDELDEVLLGTVSADRSRHLAGCAECRAQLENFTSSMAVFNQASTAWSEARSNALSRDLKLHRTPFRLTVRTAWSCASVLVLLAAGTLGIELHQRSTDLVASQAEARRIQSQVNTASTANGTSEIASDDAMLREIDAAINNSEPSPEELYGTSTSSTATSHNGHRAQVRD